jgi:hypothetical protein
MKPDENAYPRAVIDARLAGLIDALPARPDWYPRWRRLGSGSTDEERLAVYQTIRDSGILPAEAGFYLLSSQVDAISNLDVETSLGPMEERLRDIEVAHGLEEGEIWEPGEAPKEYEALLKQYHDAWDECFATQLDSYGESEIAAVFRTDREEYERRHEAGREFFFGPLAADDPDLPAWLNSLFEDIGAGLTPEGLMGPLGFRWHEEEGFCEVDAYPTPVEVVGGAADGAVLAPGFSLDLEQLRAVFEEIVDLGWNAFGWPDGEGPFIWVEGTYQGRSIFLRVLSEAPEGEEPGAKFRVPRQERG